jgi:pseudouridine-5'-phosphate glycosidase/pseudouridine kinase
VVLAHLAGIKIFATGGLGGVHRGGENSLDISADLTELGRTPVTVISSGCKSFLDIPRTLEFLETQGVLVGTFSDGRRGKVDFPSFWTRESGILSPLTIQDEKEAAAIICEHLIGLFSSRPGLSDDELQMHSLASVSPLDCSLQIQFWKKTPSQKRKWMKLLLVH